MKVCKAKHEMPDTAKFCGECGSAAEEGGVVKAVTAEELTGALSALDELYKSTSALDADLDDGDDPDDPDGDENDGAEVDDLAKAVTPDADGNVDAMPVLRAMFQANNAHARRLGVVGRENRATRREVGILAKAVATVVAGVLHKLDQISSPQAALVPGMAPRRATLNIVEKAIAGLDPADNTPRGEALWRPAVDAELAGRLPAGSATKIQRLANEGHTLKSIAAIDPLLGHQLQGVFIQAA